MVRETRHLWVGNLPDNIREDRIREHFKRYGRVQNVKILGRTDVTPAVVANGTSGICATVAFMDIKSASKAHNAEHVLDERTLTTDYYEPAAIPSATGAPSAGSSPAGSGYSGSSSSVNSTPAPASVSRYHLSGGEDSSSNTCPIAASAAAPVTWRGTNDSATEYCRRGNTPAAYGRYQRNNTTAPYSTPPSNVERTTPHHRWYASDRVANATGGESTPSTPGGGTEGGRRRRHSGSGSSRSDSSSPEPSDTSRASTPATQPPLSHHNNHRTPPALQHQWASTANGRPLAICVRNLPTRSTDSSLKDGLYHEYKKHGKVVWVKVVGQNADRYAVVRFKKPSDVEKALEVSQDKLFFGCKISVAPHQSCDEDADSAKPYETDIDEYHPKATRTLFIGNLEKDVTQQQLRDKFKHFGRIIEIDIKKGSSGGAGYAFCQYASISSVVEAIRAMDGEYVGGSRVKLGFGKPVATTCVWVDGLTEHTEKQVLSAVSRCGGATSVCVDRAAGAALVHFEQAAAAGAAVRELRRVAAAVSAAEPDHPRLCVDYASRECQEAFYEQLEKHGGTAALTGSERLSGDVPTTRYLPSARHDPIRYDSCTSRSRASSYGRSSSRTPRYNATLDHYDPTDYAADRRYRVYDEVGSSPQPEDTTYEERLQSVVVSPHRARRHRRDSSPDDRKHSKERHRSAGARRSRSGSRCAERHALRRKHRRRRDGSGSRSRAGTPLRDEPDAPPAEPRRAPRERPPLPMSLPLPKFAVQLLRAVPPAPRPPPAPAPDSPPRPPSVSSSSGGSAPHSPSLEERIRSLDEKLNGSRIITDAPDRARLRHRLLEIDINEVKPSEVVRSLLAKRSVFDEDSERLEGATRAPSPCGSPRSTPHCTPRALRYPFPAHPPPPPQTPPDEPRPCPRTPDVAEREQSEALPVFEFETNEKLFERRSEDCFSEQTEGVASVSDVHKKPGIEDETPSRDKDVNHLSRRTQKDYFNLIKATPLIPKIVKEEILEPENRGLDSLIFHNEENSARDVLDMLLNRVENCYDVQNHEIEAPIDKRYKAIKDHVIKPEFNKIDGIKVESESKLHLINQKDNHKGKDIHENEIAKEITQLDIPKNHLNSLRHSNLDLNEDLLKNTEKLLNHNVPVTKPEKENIHFQKEKLSPLDKKIIDCDKSNDERVRIDRDKTRHHCKERTEKDKHDFEKERNKIKSEKYVDRDRKFKEDDKFPLDKTEKIKIERDSDKYHHKDKTEKDVEKSKHIDEKVIKHEHHKKDRNEKDKRKESVDTDSTVSHKTKKDDKHKYERSKKDSEAKRETKKDSESGKHRKSSRDESTRDLCRKDSTDSSTSRASHESAKIKDTDNNDGKEEAKLKQKHSELFQRHECDKELTTITVKTEIKEERDSNSNKNTIVNNESPGLKSKGDIEKQRHYSLDSPAVDTKRKERLSSCSSLPSNIGHKRRMSSQDSLDSFNDDVKRGRNEMKMPERRDSKDSRIENRHKTTKFSKGHFAKIIESKTKDDKKNQVKPQDDIYIESKENDRVDSKDQKNNDKLKLLKRSPKAEVEQKFNIDTTSEGLRNDLDFLATLELRSSEEDERQKALRKEMKEKKRIQQLQQIQELQMQQDALQQAELLGKNKDDKKVKSDDKKKETSREKRLSTDRKSRDERIDYNKRKNRKLTQSSSSSDSDEPKKHSIFDIVDDGPTYISMYDKVKARSCKNMQKQEEEKRQEKIKAKFSQLKQSRAKREEKKRSSWDEDSDSDQDTKKNLKSSIDGGSSEDENMGKHSRKRDKGHVFDFERSKLEDYFDGSTNDEDPRNKLSRKNSRTRIMSDSSDDEISKRSPSKSPCFPENVKKDLLSDSASIQRLKNDIIKDVDSNGKKHSLLNLFGKSDSDDSKLKLHLGNDNGYKSNIVKSLSNEFSSENESTSNKMIEENRRKQKKKQRKHKSMYSDEEMKNENRDTNLDGEHKLKQRRHSTKKEKRKDKLRDSIDTDENRDDKNRLKKEKKLSNISFDVASDNIVSSIKKDGKMEDIFGPLSDDSDRESRDNIAHKTDYSPHDLESPFCANDSENKLKDKDDSIKRKKEKKRREKRYFKEDENSLDVDAVSKAIEARLFADTLTDNDNCQIGIETISENLNKIDHSELKLMETSLINEITRNDKLKKECKEKKKKKKKNREDRQSRKDHHYHHQQEKNEKSGSHDHNITDNPSIPPKTVLLDIPLPNDKHAINHDDKVDDSSINQSLPRLTDSPPIVIQCDENKDDLSSIDLSDVIIENKKMNYIDNKEIEIEEIPMPPPYETVVTTDISEVPLPKEPLPNKLNHNRDDFLLSLSNEDDLCNDAVRTITNSEKEPEKSEKASDLDVSSIGKLEKKSDEKPRAIISQEETEDAVAALLGESFGGKTNDFTNYEETENESAMQIQVESAISENENIPEEDAEEMRQAVQNLNASEMEMKPDTPVSDSDLLLIDTDTEEADEVTQDAVEKLPINIITTSQSVNPVSERIKTENHSNTIQTKSHLMNSAIQQSDSDLNQAKTKETVREDCDVKIQLAKRDSPIQLITSAATPVITSWTLSNQKLMEPSILNIESNMLPNRDKDIKSTHITANILQIKPALTQNLDTNGRPLLTSSRMSAPYQVINQMIRSQAPNMQPPTIKIPEPHLLYQKSQNIVVSPRMTNDIRVQSPKASAQNEGMTSPRLTNVTILSSSPQTLNAVGITSPNAIQQRSPGQMKVVRMQQPQLSPLQTIHMPHGSRPMLSPNRPNSVLVQSSPIHFNRLPITPLLAPITKQINVNNLIQQNKAIGISAPTVLHHQKHLSTDCKITESRTLSETETSKIILSPSNLQHNTNPTVMAQNRLISMQNALHISNASSAGHINNKLLINSVSPLNDKKDNQIHRPDQINNILMTGISNATSSIIQSGSKSISCNLPEMSLKTSRPQNSNVIQALNSQRILAQTPLNNIIELEKGVISTKGTTVLSMATIRPPSIIAKLELSTSPTVATTTISNVSPMLLTTSNPLTSIRHSPKFEKVDTESQTSSFQSHTRENEKKMNEKVELKRLVIQVSDAKEKQDLQPKECEPENIAKCETDFEELLKDNTNEIKVTNDPDMKLEVNVGKNITLITTTNSSSQNTIDNITVNVPTAKTNTVDTYKTEPLLHNVKDENIMDNNSQPCEIDGPQPDIDIKQEELISRTDNVVQDTIPSEKQTAATENKNIVKLENMDTDSKHTLLTLTPQPSKTSDNHLKNDDNDSWSAKDVNIQSVIKKVDSLCSDNMEILQKLNEHVSKLEQKEVIKSEEVKINDNINDGIPHINHSTVNSQAENTIDNFVQDSLEDKFVPTVNAKRGGRSVRGKKMDKNLDRIQTRQISKPLRGMSSKRGRGRAKVDKKIKNLVNSGATTMPGDIYDFHEDSGDETTASPNKTEARPRLILTIKSPLSGQSNTIATSTYSVSAKDQPKPIDRSKDDKSEEFISPSPNTRKSRRLQEKDVQRNTVDDVIEDVVRGPPKTVDTKKETNKKRPTRQTGVKIGQDKLSSPDTRKSPRGSKRARDQSLSDASADSGDERSPKECTKEAKEPRLDEPAAPEREPAPLPRGPVFPQAPASAPTPITKPPKKMISEISAKLACAFEAAAATGLGERVLAEGGGEAAPARRLADAVPGALVPGALVPAGAGEAADARVQSPALPHRPPSAPLAPLAPQAHRAADRATPVLLRGVRARSPTAAAAAAHEPAPAPGPAAPPRAYRAYAATASLPRGAHHPPHDQHRDPHHNPHHHHAGTTSRVTVASVPSISPQGQIGMSADLERSPPPAHQQTSPVTTGDGMYPHFSHQHYQMYQQHFRATQHESRATPSPYTRPSEAEGCEAPTAALELRRLGAARGLHSPAELVYRAAPPAHRAARSPPPAHAAARPAPPARPLLAPPGPPHASQVPREADSLQMLLRRYPVMWQGLLALKNDCAAVQMHFVGGSMAVAGDTLARHHDAAPPLLRIAQRMRLEPPQLDQVHRKMKMENEHCMLLALPCGRDHMDVLQQSNNLTAGFITYLQRKQAAGIVNVAPPGHHQAMFTVHIFPSCDFANENLNRIAPDLMHRVADIAHLLIVIATV